MLLGGRAHISLDQLKEVQSQLHRVRAAVERKRSHAVQSIHQKVNKAKSSLDQQQQQQVSTAVKDFVLISDRLVQEEFSRKLAAQVQELTKNKASLELRVQNLKATKERVLQTARDQYDKEVQRTRRQWVAEEKVL